MYDDLTQDVQDDVQVQEVPQEQEEFAVKFEDFIHGTPDEVDLDEITETSEEEIIDENAEVVTEEEEVSEQVETEEILPTMKEFYDKPETFENVEDEVEWYKSKLETLHKIFDKEEGYLQDYVASTKEEVLKGLEEEFTGMAEMYTAMKQDPRGFLLQYMPEALEAYGVNPVMSHEQILDRVKTDLTKEFGDNYLSKVDPSQMFSPGSFTSQVWARQLQLTQEYQQLNVRNQQLLENWNKHVKEGKLPERVDEAEMKRQQEEYLKSEYKRYFAPKLGWKEEEFNSFVEEASKRQLTLEDAEKLVNFDKYLQRAYKKGLQDKGKATLSKVKQQSQSSKQVSPIAQPSVQDDRTQEFLQVMMNGGIPSY